MFSAVKNSVFASMLLLLFSCNEGKKLISHSVTEISSKNSREIEEMGSFYVTGRVNGKINLGFIKAFKFVDLKNDEQAIYIISHHKALPSNNSELTINLKLYQEIALNDSDFIIFEED